MKSTGVLVRHRRAGMFAVLTAGWAAATLVCLPSATAGPDPCSAAEVAKSIGMVATSTGTYLDGHPEANQALTAASQQQAGPQSVVALKTYFDAHPQEGAVIQQLQQPLVTLSSRCKLPLTLPQLMGLAQSAPAGALPGGLPSVPSPASAPSSPSLLPGVTVGSALPAAQAASAPVAH